MSYTVSYPPHVILPPLIMRVIAVARLVVKTACIEYSLRNEAWILYTLLQTEREMREICLLI